VITLKLKPWNLFAGLLAVLGAASPAAPAEQSAANPAQALVKRYAGALVHINLVVSLKVTAAGQALPAREIKRDVVGTVVSPAGLIVLSLAALDPSEMLEGTRINTAKGPVQLEAVGSEFKAVKIRRPDGSEVAARVVMKDNDLDLAFVAPVQPDALSPYVFVDLANEATPELLGTGYVLSRASRAFQSAPVIQRSDIISILEKPRRRLLVQTAAASCPMFDAEGRVYGICVRQMAGGRLAGTYVLSAADVAEVAKQAAAEAAKPIEQPAPTVEESPAPEKKPEPEPAKG